MDSIIRPTHAASSTGSTMAPAVLPATVEPQTTTSAAPGGVSQSGLGPCILSGVSPASLTSTATAALPSVSPRAAVAIPVPVPATAVQVLKPLGEHQHVPNLPARLLLAVLTLSHLLEAQTVSATSTASRLSTSVTSAQSHALSKQSLLAFSLSTGCPSSSPSATSPTELLDQIILEVIDDACEAALNTDSKDPTPLKAKGLFSNIKDSVPSPLPLELIVVFPTSKY